MKLAAYLGALALAVLFTVDAVSAHGGGCRKGYGNQCCHMDNSTGSVHCH